MGPEGLFASLITCLSTGRVRSTSSTITSTHMRIHPIYPIYTICPISNPFWNSIASPWSLAGPCKVCHAQNVSRMLMEAEQDQADGADWVDRIDWVDFSCSRTSPTRKNDPVMTTTSSG